MRLDPSAPYQPTHLARPVRAKDGHFVVHLVIEGERVDGEREHCDGWLREEVGRVSKAFGRGGGLDGAVENF